MSEGECASAEESPPALSLRSVPTLRLRRKIDRREVFLDWAGYDAGLGAAQLNT